MEVNLESARYIVGRVLAVTEAAYSMAMRRVLLRRIDEAVATGETEDNVYWRD